MIIWVIAGLLGVATGVRIGWALVNKQSVVSAAMMFALGSLGALAALNWPPLTLLIDTAVNWPNISIALSQVALIMCAASSCVMITSASSSRKPEITRRIAWAQYLIASIIAAVSLAVFFADGRQQEMSPQEYLKQYLGSHTSLPWLLPLLYVLFALSVVSATGVRYSSPSRRGRALFIFTIGITLIVLASAFFFARVIITTELVGVGVAVWVLAFAMLVVATGALLPTIEDWFGARRELSVIDPLLNELGRRQPDVGIGVRPHGPLTFRVAERMSLISDALFLEATQVGDTQAPMRPIAERAAATSGAEPTRLLDDADLPDVSPRQQARAIAEWVYDTRDGRQNGRFPGVDWLRQPRQYSDREWILAIAHQYRDFHRKDAASLEERDFVD
ncbi:MAG: hypothetical protein JO152_07745 [Mycobacteriaceae bacterium]|nr:hypothetical protein [Mycobacteriaceae bacterium]